MENRDGHDLLKFLLDVETIRSFQIFQIDSTKRGSQAFDTVDEIIGIGRINTDIDGLDASKLVEKDGLAFHDRLGGEGAKVTKTEDGSAIGNDSDGVALVGVLVGSFGVLSNLDARDGDTWRVGQRQIFLVIHWLGRLDGVLSWDRGGMVKERLLFFVGSTLDKGGSSESCVSLFIYVGLPFGL